MTALEIARLEIHAPAGWKATLRRAASRTGRQRSQCLSWVIFVTPGHRRGSKTFFRGVRIIARLLRGLDITKVVSVQSCRLPRNAIASLRFNYQARVICGHALLCAYMLRFKSKKDKHCIRSHLHLLDSLGIYCKYVVLLLQTSGSRKQKLSVVFKIAGSALHLVHNLVLQFIYSAPELHDIVYMASKHDHS